MAHQGVENVNIHFLIRKFRYRRLKVLENYLAFAGDDNNYIHSEEFRILDSELKEEAKEENLFSYLDEYNKIKEKYNIDGIDTVDNDFEKAKAIMQWLTDNTYYCGMSFKILPDDTLEMLKYSYQKGFSGAINCRDKAIALTDLLLSHGIKAYPILLYNITKTDCHFVTHVYCKELEKWVVLDPSFNTYFTDESGNILNIFGLRELKLQGKEPIANGYSFNKTQQAKDIYLKYFIGNGLARISTWNDNSNDGRKTKNMGKRKNFEYRIPEGHR